MRRLTLVPVSIAIVALASPAAATVFTAADLCSPSADPCVVSQPLQVTAGADLDLGLRTLRIEGAGLLDFADGRGSIACGRLETRTNGPAIRMRAETSPASTLTILARGRCSLAARPCLLDADCSGAGRCVAGEGTIELHGGVFGNADSPGHLVIRSAGDLSVHAPLTLAGTRTSSDGGTVSLESVGGSVLLAGGIDASGGGGGTGGEVSATALLDVVAEGWIVATGGEYGGGSVWLAAGRDITISNDVAVDSLAVDGSGGEIDAVAGRDVVLAGSTAAGGIVLSADGHQSAENYGGDGGSMSFEADGSIRVAANVKLAASAAAPDGFGDSLSFDAGLDVEFDGTVVAKGRGTWGGGALVELDSGRDVRAGSRAVFDLTGAGAGGDLMVEAGRAFSFDGEADVSGGPSGIGGRIVTVSGADTSIDGVWTTDGVESAFTVGEVFVEACRLVVGGRIANRAEAGRVRLLAHADLRVNAGASVVASGERATNSFTCRDAANLPLVAGTVSPPPQVSIDGALSTCSVCGNAELEEGEGCDDGNEAGGDGCSALCDIEGCLGSDPDLPLAVTKLRARFGGEPATDRLSWTGTLAVPAMPPDLSATIVRVVLADGDAQVLCEAELPPGSLVRERSAWRLASDAAPAAVQQLSIADGRDGRPRVRARLRNLDLSHARHAGALRLALEVDSASDDAAACFGSGSLDCRAARSGLSCETLR